MPLCVFLDYVLQWKLDPKNGETSELWAGKACCSARALWEVAALTNGGKAAEVGMPGSGTCNSQREHLLDERHHQ